MSWIVIMTVGLLSAFCQSSSFGCPIECICLSQTQVLCNTGTLTEIPVKSLPPTVEQLALNKHNFPIIKSDAFNGLRMLKKLSLDSNNISTIKPFAFRGLPRLTDLSIQHTPLTAIGQFSFAGMHNLTTILLAHNKIQRIEGYAFAGTSNVKFIILTHNPMTKIDTSAFSGLTNVEHLVLPSGIRAIERDSFNGLDTVGLLKLAFMDLDALRPFTFRGLSHVNVLSIQESDLGIIRADAFEGMSHVANLNLLNNKIDAIQELKIKNNNHVKLLKLFGNHLLETPTVGAVNLVGLESLIVADNHFPCDCHIHSLLEGPLANYTNQQDNFIAKNYCISPMEYNGKLLKEIDLFSIGRCQEQVTRENLASSLGFPLKLSTFCCRYNTFLSLLVIFYVS